MFSFLNYSSPDIIPINKKTKRCVDFVDTPKLSFLLLRTGKKENIRTAEEHLNSLLNMQEKNPQSPYYGLWLTKEDLPHGVEGNYDANMTTYIGIPLFVVLAEYGHILPTYLSKKIEASLSSACIFIMQRNIHLQNTHITIAESFLTAACGEKFQNLEFINYSLNLFQNFYHYNISQGSFAEYNTAEYDKNNLYVLYLSKRYIKNDIFLQLTEIVYDDLWSIAARQYHYQTNNFAGPSHRTSDLFLSDRVRSFYTSACSGVAKSSGELSFVGICPQKFRSYFTGIKQDEYSQKIVSQGNAVNLRKEHMTTSPSVFGEVNRHMFFSCFISKIGIANKAI